MDFIEQSCQSFTDVLASKEAVPGGGGASALVGAIGIALCSMVGNLTIGRKKYAAVEADVKQMLHKGEVLRKELLTLVDEDARAFEPLSKAYAIPKDAPEREAVMNDALEKACAAPLKMMNCCAEALDLLSEMLEKGSVMLLSDVGCGAAFCKAALVAASMNVFINTGSLADKVKSGAMEKEADELVEKYSEIADHIINQVENRIRKKV